eukprot:TRINITY_DN1418_c0_g1_i1.p2 TRINITY_DN1418_c0_g1~~TRINITY_DN1418_c0_g1_i1.p2  ORF type:complete len:176 (+),score=20.22 TRINITY_DN1418_c0_g1_i1:934-1461(+)
MGRLYCGDREGLVRLVPDKLTPAGFDCVQMGLSGGLAPPITDYGRHLLSLNDLQRSQFARQLSPTIKLNLLPLLERFSGCPDAMERFFAHITEAESELGSPFVWKTLTEWIYADKLPSAWYSTDIQPEKICSCAEYLEQLFAVADLREEAEICAAVKRFADPSTKSRASYEEVMR